MGVTIHFEGQLTNEAAYQSLINLVSSFANDHGWQTEPIASDEVTLQRVRDEKDWDYTGPVRGIAVYLHPDCDPVRFEFDKNLYLQEFTKTQFAGAEYHLKVINLLRTAQPLFRELKVDDEGEFWDTGDLATLQDHLEKVEKIIQEMLKENPAARAKVKTPEGRIMDLMK
jgi:hypothetical protein